MRPGSRRGSVIRSHWPTAGRTPGRTTSSDPGAAAPPGEAPGPPSCPQDRRGTGALRAQAMAARTWAWLDTHCMRLT